MIHSEKLAFLALGNFNKLHIYTMQILNITLQIITLHLTAIIGI